jgi:ribosome biogenesis GTPase
LSHLASGPLPVTLYALGWTPAEQLEWDSKQRPERVPARVTGLHRDHIVDLMTAEGPLQGRPAGRMLQGQTDAEAMPTVGDWVEAGEDGTVHEILPRRTRLARRSPADRDRIQVLAANVDVVIVLSSLNMDHKIERLSRMVAMADASGARTVVALSKSDLVDDSDPTVEEARERFPNLEVFAFSSETLKGLDQLRESLNPTETVVLLGSSGVGKSTLANTLLGYERQKTVEIRGRDDRGRHATTSREMIGLPCGTLMIDTPGMRAPGMLVEEPADERAEEIERLSAYCKFRDCAHGSEPGCAVTAAIEAGELPPA